METAYIKSPLGITRLEGDEKGLSSIRVMDEFHDQLLTQTVPKVLEDVVSQLSDYFDGTRKGFQLKLNPQGTDFQKKVWTALQDIPYGKTISYLELSKTLGNVKAIRAVAAANGKNPLWIVIPCHRVVGSDGSLTGYAGGLSRKKWLLAHESPSQQQTLF
ncbi:methylated-DNA--[protein]-cysteine S-methyltransferase [Pareuzebyella sediminis]|uniref:methylated-DNA--[protein]-cysteine S-methyltransferase n=1 Tax=Pareuzebyella sediminis TaxID=2607998 RepID=UPI0011EE22D2|nr:methylated-DNA--[protein]-cysteine S-methyltransferase [Pareuzebyella sediminis]